MRGKKDEHSRQTSEVSETSEVFCDAIIFGNADDAAIMAEPAATNERPFDADEKKTTRSTRLLCVVVGVQWLLAIMQPFTLFSPAILLILPWGMVRADRFTRWLLLVSSPLTLIIGLGIAQYFRGAATLQTAGLPETTFHNLDPVTRCGRTGGGCIVCGNEWLWDSLHNITIEILVWSFGYSRGTYTGPYPTKEEAQTALASAHMVSWADLRKDEVPLSADLIRLQAGVGAVLCDRAQRFLFSPEDLGRDELKVRGILWRNECLILRIPVNPNDPGSAMIVLVSRTAGRPFAYYGEGEYYHRFPPVPWTPKND